MYHHVASAQKVTGPVNWRTHHHNHLLLDSIAAIATAMLLTDCAFDGNGDPDFAMSLTPYFANCLEEDMPSAGCM